MRPALWCLVGCLTGMPAAAQWLNLCPAGQTGVGTPGYLSHIDLGNGRFERLSLTENAEPGCPVLPFRAAPDQVQWTRIVPYPAALRGVHQVVLQGSRQDLGFHVSELIVPEHPGPSYVGRKMVLPGLELLTKFTLETFGEEARAELDDSNPATVSLHCAPGSRPAGLVLKVSSSLPQRAALQLALTAQGSGRFTVGYSDQARHIAGDPIMLGELNLSSANSDRRFTFGPPADPEIRADWRSLTLACPGEGGHLALSGLRLEVAGEKAAPGRASWYWSAASWRLKPEAVLAQQRDWRLRRIYLGIDFRDGSVADTESLRHFVARAHETGLDVWAVLGDPAAIRPTGRLRYQNLVVALGDYNKDAPPASRLNGIQLDIEPYLDAAYQGQEQLWKSEYLAAISAISATSPLPVEVVLPFWLDDPRFLAGLAGSVRGVTVMDYRTDPLFITERALPFLEWGDAYGIPVFIALESGRLAAAERRYYAAAARGELHAVELAGKTVLALLDRPAHPEVGTAYELRSSVRVEFDHVSFFGRDDQLTALLPRLERQFSAWNSFAGIAVHGLDQRL